MNFHNIEMITIEDIQEQTKEVSIRFLYNDYYRKWIKNQKVLAWNGNGWQLASFYSRHGKKLNYGIQMDIVDSESYFHNTRDRTAINIQDRRALYSANIQIAATDSVALFGVGLNLGTTEYKTPIKIKEYPNSENAAMRTFFLDWLEPTFGKKINLDGYRLIRQPQIFASIPVYKKNRLTLLYRYSYSRYNPTISYENSSNIPELTGQRKITVPGELKESVFNVNLTNVPNQLQLSLLYFMTRIDFNVDNNPPMTEPNLLDLEKLGNGKGDRQGVALKLMGSNEHYQLLIGLGYSHIFFSLELVTPVLGRIVLPISHGIEGDITGTSTTQRIELTYTKVFRYLETNFLFGYTHGFYDFLIDGDAQLEFNLTSQPIHHPLQYQAHLWEFRGQFERQLGPVTIVYSFNQLIPIVKRTDSSPIKFKEKDIIVNTSHWGGGVHSISFWYRW